MPVSPGLVIQARALLDRARLIAEAPAAPEAQIGHGHPDSKAPPGAFTYTVSTLDACGQRINQAIVTGSDSELQAAITWCSSEIQALQHGPPGREAETAGQFRWRIVHNYEGVATAVVARRELCSERKVREIRAEAGLDSKGRKLRGEGGGA